MTGSIKGFVSDYTNANAAIAGATVTINSKGLTKTTGSDGRFEFTELEPGTYSIAVSANNYQATTKQVTVYAGQSVNCDFQLEKASANVEISPVTLTFGQDVDQLSFSIKNNSNQSLNYSISDVPEYVEVSPASGTAAAKSTQAVSVKIKDRSNITTNRNGQLKVNIGNDSYIISISVDAYNDTSTDITISPKTLTFDKDTELLTFTMTSGHSQELTYKISSDLDILTVNPAEGKLAARSKVEVSVKINDRKEVAEFRTGALTITIGNNTYVVSVSIAKYEGNNLQDDNNGDSNGDNNSNSIAVPNGLYAYFTFENNTKDITDTELSGTGVGTTYVDSYNGTKALNIPATASAMFSVPNALVDQQEMSISFWVKDLYDGHVFHAVRSTDSKAAFLLSVENGMLKFVGNNYNIYYKYSDSDIQNFTHNALDGWHMITLVSDYNKTSYYTITTRLYIDGVYTDVLTETEKGGGYESYNSCTKFILGGEMMTTGNYGPKLNATKIVIDNFRVYRNRRLNEQEIETIYNSEKR